MPQTISFNSKLIDTMTREGNDVIVVWKTNGSSTRFRDVPENVWTDWRNDSSVGSFYHANIKGQYAGEKV